MPRVKRSEAQPRATEPVDCVNPYLPRRGRGRLRSPLIPRPFRAEKKGEGASRPTGSVPIVIGTSPVATIHDPSGVRKSARTDISDLCAP